MTTKTAGTEQTPKANRKTERAARRAAKLAASPATVAETQQAMSQADNTERVAAKVAAKAKTAKPKAEPKPKPTFRGIVVRRNGKLSAAGLPCLCGCGGATVTDAAQFISGHDAKLRKAILGGAELPAIAQPFADHGDLDRLLGDHSGEAEGE